MVPISAFEAHFLDFAKLEKNAKKTQSRAWSQTLKKYLKKPETVQHNFRFRGQFRKVEKSSNSNLIITYFEFEGHNSRQTQKRLKMGVGPNSKFRVWAKSHFEFVLSCS